jgi:DNA-directed RNA polymerase specialized sigma24 family protein
MHDQQQEEVAAAARAAKEGEVVLYLEHLAASHALDGLLRKLSADWPTTDRHAIHDAICAGTDSLYVKLYTGGLVTNPVGYLYVAAKQQLVGRYHRQAQLVPLDEDVRDPSPIPGEGVQDRRPDLRDEALRVARSLLPRLGQASVQAVMKVIFDAVEANMPIENETISEITGLTPETVRRAKSRGWERLAREARRIGIAVPDAEPGDRDEPSD